MAFKNDITSANATLILIVDDLYPSGIQLQQFSADSAASMETLQIAETRMGVDGKLAAGYTPAIFSVTVSLEATSPSYTYLSLIWQTMAKKKKPFKCTLVATVPSINAVYTWSTGVLVSGSPMPSINRVLEPTTWEFQFQDFVAAVANV